MNLLANPEHPDDPLVRRADISRALTPQASPRTVEAWFDADDIVKVGRFACVPLSTAVRVVSEKGYALDVSDLAEDAPRAPVVGLPQRPDVQVPTVGLRSVPTTPSIIDQLADLAQSQAERADAAEAETVRLRSELVAMKVVLARHGLLESDPERG